MALFCFAKVSRSVLHKNRVLAIKGKPVTNLSFVIYQNLSRQGYCFQMTLSLMAGAKNVILRFFFRKAKILIVAPTDSTDGWADFGGNDWNDDIKFHSYCWNHFLFLNTWLNFYFEVFGTKISCKMFNCGEVTFTQHLSFLMCSGKLRALYLDLLTCCFGTRLVYPYTYTLHGMVRS